MHRYLGLIVALLIAPSAGAVSTSFTYQGSLQDAGSPANGSYDLQFQLQTAAGGNVGAPLVREDVSIVGGLFSVELDFGPSITGADFRLQIGVRPGTATGAYTTLAPTTNLRPAPQAQVAGIAAEAVTVSPDSITSASIQSGAVTTSDIADNTVQSADIADGTVGALDVNVNEVQWRVSTACSPGQAIRSIAANGAVTCENTVGGGGTVTSIATGTGLTGGPITASGTISIASGGVTSALIADGTVANADLAANSVGAANIADGAVGSADINSAQVQARISGTCLVGSAVRAVNADGTVSCETDDIGWSLGGNIGTNPTTNYIGTFDAQPFVIRTQNARSLRIEPSAELFGGAPITTNLIAGSSANGVSSGVRGATIAGGGLPSGDSDPFFFDEAPNRVTDVYGTVGGGFNNVAGNDGGTTTDAYLATVAGGARNRASDLWTTVGGGILNIASDEAGTVAGGFNNTAAGAGSSVPGGVLNCAGGRDSVAMGRRAKVRVAAGLTAEQIGAGCLDVANSGDGNGDEGTFVWADGQGADFVSGAPNQFLVRADGGFGINRQPGPQDDLVIKARAVAGDASADVRLFTRLEKTAALQLEETTGSLRIALPTIVGGSPRLVVEGGSGGLAFLTNGGAWTNASSRSFKSDFNAVDTLDVLARLVDLPITTWNYIGSGEGMHMGPIAEDFKAAFGLAGDGKSIATVDADGVALAAIQGLNRKLETENAALRAETAALRARLAAIEARLDAR